MRTAALLVVALLACSVSGRKLLQADCSNAAATIKSFPQTTDIGTVIGDFNLLPTGIPSDATIFLPNNDAVAALLSTVQTFLPNATLATLPSMLQGSPLQSTVMNKLESVILYHISLNGAMTPNELDAEGTIITALPGKDLMFMFNGTVGTITDASNQNVTVEAGPVAVCGSNVYIINKVLMPNANLLAIPDTTPAQAAAILSRSGAMSPGMAPSMAPGMAPGMAPMGM